LVCVESVVLPAFFVLRRGARVLSFRGRLELLFDIAESYGPPEKATRKR
jgi:hypothetical protein